MYYYPTFNKVKKTGKEYIERFPADYEMRYRIPSEFELITGFKYEVLNLATNTWDKVTWVDFLKLCELHPNYGINTKLNIWKDRWESFKKLKENGQIRCERTGHWVKYWYTLNGIPNTLKIRPILSPYVNDLYPSSIQIPVNKDNASMSLKMVLNEDLNNNLETMSMKSNKKIKLKQFLTDSGDLIIPTNLIQQSYIVTHKNGELIIIATSLSQVFRRLKIQYKIDKGSILRIATAKEPSIDLYLKVPDNKPRKKYISTYQNMPHYKDKMICIKRAIEFDDKGIPNKWEIKRVRKSELGKKYSTHEWEFTSKSSYKAQGRPIKEIKTFKVNIAKAHKSGRLSRTSYTTEEWLKLKDLYRELNISTKREWDEIIADINNIKYAARGRKLSICKHMKVYDDGHYKYVDKYTKVENKYIPLSEVEYIKPPSENIIKQDTKNIRRTQKLLKKNFVNSNKYNSKRKVKKSIKNPHLRKKIRNNIQTYNKLKEYVDNSNLISERIRYQSLQRKIKKGSTGEGDKDSNVK